MTETTQDGADVVERDNRDLVISMLRAQIRSLGHMPCVVENHEAAIADKQREADLMSELTRLRSDNERLREALRDLVSDREAVAKYSWKTWMNGEWHWNDEIWERNDPDEFELIKAARAALSKASPVTGDPSE